MSCRSGGQGRQRRHSYVLILVDACIACVALGWPSAALPVHILASFVQSKALCVLLASTPSCCHGSGQGALAVSTAAACLLCGPACMATCVLGVPLLLLLLQEGN